MKSLQNFSVDFTVVNIFLEKFHHTAWDLNNLLLRKIPSLQGQYQLTVNNNLLAKLCVTLKSLWLSIIGEFSSYYVLLEKKTTKSNKIFHYTTGVFLIYLVWCQNTQKRVTSTTEHFSCSFTDDEFVLLSLGAALAMWNFFCPTYLSHFTLQYDLLTHYNTDSTTSTLLLYVTCSLKVFTCRAHLANTARF